MARKSQEKTKVKGYISVSEEDKALYLNSPEYNKRIKQIEPRFLKEAFKGEVADVQVRFPKELGAAHPFEFEDVEKLYKKNGLIAGIVNKITDSIVGDFTVKVQNKNAQALLDKFVANTNFSSVIRPWIREAVLKGNGFMEIDLKEQKIRVMNANHMYVKRDNKSRIIAYNQYLGNIEKFRPNSRKLITFKPDQIAHLPINKIPNDPYGIGLIWPNERVIENLVLNEEELHKLIKRKAGAPIHVKIGREGEAVNPSDIDDFADKLKYMNNRTEWVTDANAEMKVLDFGEIGKNLTDTLQYDLETLSYGVEIPLVILGKANVPEGLAKVQLEAFQRKIQSIREQIESVIEEKIFRPILRAQKNKQFDQDVEFIWNLPGEEEINKRIERLSKLLENFSLSENMRRMVELEIARLLEFKNAERFLQKPEVGLDEEKQEEPERKEEEEEIPQPEVPGAKPAAQEISESVEDLIKNDMKRKASGEMTVKEFINIKEAKTFNYSDYLIRILRRLRVDKFANLAAKTEEEILEGLLPKQDIKRLRTILKEAFRKNKTIREIEEHIKQNIEIKDRVKEGKVIIPAEQRPNMIARTETVRLANEGLLDLYKENKIDHVRFLAALSDRTCPICEELNGRIFLTNQADGIIPVHPGCRCSFVAVVE